MDVTSGLTAFLAGEGDEVSRECRSYNAEDKALCASPI
jgi:hypothetical protein